MPEQTTLGIVGLGGISAAHLNAAAALPGLQIAYAVEPDAEKRTAFEQQHGGRAFASLTELLADNDARKALQGLVLCTPPSIRYDFVAEAMSAGLGVLTEKPLAHTPDSAARLVELVHAHPGVPARVAYCHRFTPAILEIQRMLQAGELGELVRFENTFACWHPTMRDHWMSDPRSSGGGALIDTGSHGLDLFHFLCGPSRLEGVVRRQGWPGRGDSNATLLVSTAPDARPAVAGVLNAGWAEPARFLLTVVGTHGLVGYDYESPETLVFKPSEGEPSSRPVETHETRFTHQLAAFAALLDAPDVPSTLCTFQEAAAVAEVLADDHAAIG
jgi:predicted dehydrogenase